MVTDNHDWRQKLNRIIQNEGLNVTTLSEECGLNRDYISRLINNPNSNPKLASLEAICQKLGTSVSELMTADSEDGRRERAIQRNSKKGLDEVARFNEFLRSEASVKAATGSQT